MSHVYERMLRLHPARNEETLSHHQDNGLAILELLSQPGQASTSRASYHSFEALVPLKPEKSQQHCSFVA